jgi:hypothetical protein
MTSFIAACGSGRSTSFIPAIRAARSVTTIAFIVHLHVRGMSSTAGLANVDPVVAVSGVTRDPFVFLVEGDPGSAEPVLPTLERGAGGKVPATIGDFSVRPGAHPRQKGEPCDRYE